MTQQIPTKFIHPYSDTKHFTANDVGGLMATTSILTQLLSFLQIATQFKPENRFIDSVQLLEMIENTLPEIKTLLSKAETDLQLQQIFFKPISD